MNLQICPHKLGTCSECANKFSLENKIVKMQTEMESLQAELTKEREANQRLAGIEQALQDFTRFESTKASEVYDWLESVTGYRSGGNEPNEG